jgi:hypothetical protein
MFDEQGLRFEMLDMDSHRAGKGLVAPITLAPPLPVPGAHLQT